MAALLDRFIGHHSHTLDGKGRVSVPSPFREVLSERYDERLVVMKDYDNCLVAYPVEEWQVIDEKIRALPQSDPNVRRFLRIFYSSAQLCLLDKQGRILIPQDLKSYSGLTVDVKLVGMSNKIEIWDAATWDAENQATDNTQLRNAMAAYGV